MAYSWQKTLKAGSAITPDELNEMKQVATLVINHGCPSDRGTVYSNNSYDSSDYGDKIDNSVDVNNSYDSADDAHRADAVDFSNHCIFRFA